MARLAGVHVVAVVVEIHFTFRWMNFVTLLSSIVLLQVNHHFSCDLSVDCYLSPKSLQWPLHQKITNVTIMPLNSCFQSTLSLRNLTRKHFLVRLATRYAFLEL